MRPRRAVLLGCALACLWTFPAFADETSPVQTSSALEVSGDIRLTAIDGEKSWLEGGFGKLRSGADNDVRLQPQLGNASLVWKPQLSWSVGAVIVGMLEGGQRTQAGLSQGYLSFRPMRSQEFALSARAGLMWLPVSLEHEGSDWHVKNSITPSAINSWVGEELKPLAAEGTLATRIGENDIRATAAVTAANDTAGTLLTFRGWALHDWTTLALNRQPLPPVGVFAGVQARYTHPLLDIHEGFAKHLGYYAKLAWSPPVPIRIELLRYDNGANPQDVTSSGPEWGWRTRFDHIGMVADLGSGTEFKSQVLQGTTRMGFPAGGRRWVDERFRSAYGMVDHSMGRITFAARADIFDTHNRGSRWTDEYDEHGWAAMLSAKRQWKKLAAFVELLHVSSKTPARENAGEEEFQRQTELQTELRMTW